MEKGPDAMRAFKVELNGKRLCVAGVGENGVLTTIATYVGAANGDSLDLSVTGLFTPTDEHAIWRLVDLKVGDKVTVRVVDVGSVDRPRKRYRPDSKMAARNEKAYIRAKALKYGWEILTRPKKSR